MSQYTHNGPKLAHDAAELLSWAVDLLDLYDARLVSMGEPEKDVYAPAHQSKKIDARNMVAELRSRATPPNPQPSFDLGGSATEHP